MSTQDNTNAESRTNNDEVTINMNNEPPSAPNEENNTNQSGSQRSLSIFQFRISRDLLLNNVFQEIRPLVGRHNNGNAPFGWIRSSMQSEDHLNTPSSENAPRSIDIEASAADNVSVNAECPNYDSYARQLSTSSAPARSDSIEGGSVHEVIDSATTATTATSNVVTSQSRTSLQQNRNGSYESSTSATTNGNNENDQAANENDSLAQIPEARAFINTVSRYFPYVCILFAKSCYDHLDGILNIFALFVVFTHSNFTLKTEITGLRRMLYLIRELLYIMIVVFIIGFVLDKKDTFISPFFAPINLKDEDKPLQLKQLLFSVCITDLILKLATVAVKILFTMLPKRAVELKNRGRVYLLIEAFSQLYRAIVPIQIWLMYLLDGYKGTEKIMGVILSAAYIVAKGSDILQRVKFLKRSFIKFLQKTSFGSVPTKEQIQLAGGTCPICHDSYQDPVILNECNHLFCELCLLGWLDRENNTCPLCRHLIDQDNLGYRDGSTTYFIQFY